MPIFSDAFGNFFQGSITGSVPYTSANVLSLMQNALGNNDRVNANVDNFSWRPNLIDETLTGTISASASPNIYTNLAIPSNARMGFCPSIPDDGYAISQYRNSSNSGVWVEAIDPTFNIGDFYFEPFINLWAVANERSVAVFLQNDMGSLFISQGVLDRSDVTLVYPDNIYTYWDINIIPGNPANTLSESGAVLINSSAITCASYGVIANFAHVRDSDQQAMTSECNLALRDATTGFPFGDVPNVYIWKVDGGETAPSGIGDIVECNHYIEGQIYCKVVGRLGNANVSDHGGDWILMKVFG
jgi:hypothetical protein